MLEYTICHLLSPICDLDFSIDDKLSTETQSNQNHLRYIKAIRKYTDTPLGKFCQIICYSARKSRRVYIKIVTASQMYTIMCSTRYRLVMVNNKHILTYILTICKPPKKH